MITRLSGPASEPVSLAEARAHLRVDHQDDDALLGGLIAAARQAVELATGRALITQGFRLERDTVPDTSVLVLPIAPLLTVTQVAYDDAAGTAQVMPSGQYVVRAPAGDAPPRGCLCLAAGASWPSLREGPAALRVDFTAGYGDAADVPAALHAAILLVVGELYENREASAQGQPYQESPAVARLLEPFRLWWTE